MFRVSSERIRYLSPDEENRLFEQLDNCEWLKPVVLIALQTGMRRGEICNLQWFDLNFDRGLIHVRNTKNGKDRTIPMNATVRHAKSITSSKSTGECRKRENPGFPAHMSFRVHERRSVSSRSSIHLYEL